MERITVQPIAESGKPIRGVSYYLDFTNEPHTEARDRSGNTWILKHRVQQTEAGRDLWECVATGERALRG
jgi:hypothetical protein